MLTRDGGVYTFGTAPFYGSGAGAVNGQAVGIAGKLDLKARTPRVYRVIGHREHLGVARAVAVRPELDVVARRVRAEAACLLGAAAVPAEHPTGARARRVDLELGAQHVRPRRADAADLVEVDIERRGHDHDLVLPARCHCEPCTRIRREAFARELRAVSSPSLLTAACSTSRQAAVRARASFAVSRSPRPSRERRRTSGAAAAPAKATARPADDAREERHERVAPRERAVEVERGDGARRSRSARQIGRRRKTGRGRWRSTDIT